MLALLGLNSPVLITPFLNFCVEESALRSVLRAGPSSGEVCFLSHFSQRLAANFLQNLCGHLPRDDATCIIFLTLLKMPPTNRTEEWSNGDEPEIVSENLSWRRPAFQLQLVNKQVLNTCLPKIVLIYI